MSQIPKFCNKVLAHLLDHKEKNPEFTFALRESNRYQRLELGHWFQGSTYIYVPLFLRGDNARKVKTLGLVLIPDSNESATQYFEVSFKGSGFSSAEVAFHRELAEYLGIELNEHNHGTRDIESGSIEDNLQHYITDVRAKALELLEKHNITKGYLVSEKRFQRNLDRVMAHKDNLIKRQSILVNLTWNSNDWKEESDDESGHEYVAKGGTAHESWNFAFDNPRNSDDKILGYAQFTNPPTKVSSNNNLLIFCSQNHVVGFYGKAEILDEPEVINDKESYNLIGYRPLSLSLNNKIVNIKEKGYLGGKQRIGQIGFSYLDDNNIVRKILEEAIELNPDQEEKIKQIIGWMNFEYSDNKASTLNTNSEMNAENIPANLILYGPPGTGKTYNLQHKYLESFIIQKEIQTKEQFITETISDMTWWQVIAMALYSLKGYRGSVTEIYETNYVKQKEKISNNSTVRNQIWGQLQQHTKEECEHVNVKKRQEPLIFEKDADSIWSVDVEMLETILPEIIETHEAIENFTPTSTTATNYDFIVFHQKYAYEDFIVGITPVLAAEDEESDEGGELKFKKQYGLFYNACRKALKLAGYYSFEECEEDSLDERKRKFAEARPYAVLIDEINRANISAVFGELIGCIEGDKRLGAENELFVTLPTGGGRFGVPANLKIIGTMNTADRSIAMIDVALRRRFEFEGYYPDYSVMKNEAARKILRGLNDEILSSKKSADFLIGHAYLMHATTPEEVVTIMNNKIVPLLYEYFRNNEPMIKEVIAKNEGLGELNIGIDNESQCLLKVKHNG